MFFIPTKRPGYVLFCLTPSGRAALGLTEDQATVHLLTRSAAGAWSVLRQWPASERSQTDILLSLAAEREPEDPADLVAMIEGRKKPCQDPFSSG